MISTLNSTKYIKTIYSTMFIHTYMSWSNSDMVHKRQFYVFLWWSADFRHMIHTYGIHSYKNGIFSDVHINKGLVSNFYILGLKQLIKLFSCNIIEIYYMAWLVSDFYIIHLFSEPYHNFYAGSIFILPNVLHFIYHG